MAIALKAHGTWTTPPATGAGSVVIALPGTPAAGDRYYMWVCNKSYLIPAIAPAGWTLLYEGANGTVTPGNGTGSVRISCWYRDWQAGDSASVTVNAGTATPVWDVVSGIATLWSKGAGETWDTPVAYPAPWTGTTTNFTAQTTNTSIVVPANALVMSCIGVHDDSATFTRATTAINAIPTITWAANFVESTAAHLTTATGSDMAADIGHRFHGASTSVPTTLNTSATLSATELGHALLVVQTVSTGGGAVDTSRFFALFD